MHVAFYYIIQTRTGQDQIQDFNHHPDTCDHQGTVGRTCFASTTQLPQKLK